MHRMKIVGFSDDLPGHPAALFVQYGHFAADHRFLRGILLLRHQRLQFLKPGTGHIGGHHGAVGGGRVVTLLRRRF